jgi:pyridoxamine 5'-phosphate oxidase
MVLMKEFTPAGLVFYTNTQSIKGRQLRAAPRAALVFHWKTTQQQVRVEGQVEVVSDQEADAYFASRPRGSQLGAWASDQSRPISKRGELLLRVAAAEARYLARPVPRPPHWSGYRVLPQMIEFWYGRKSRLHERIRFSWRNGEWVREELFP